MEPKQYINGCSKLSTVHTGRQHRCNFRHPCSRSSRV